MPGLPESVWALNLTRCIHDFIRFSPSTPTHHTLDASPTRTPVSYFFPKSHKTPPQSFLSDTVPYISVLLAKPDKALYGTLRVRFSRLSLTPPLLHQISCHNLWNLITHQLTLTHSFSPSYSIYIFLYSTFLPTTYNLPEHPV